MKKIKLLPCPFCGASGISFVSNQRAFDFWYVKCFYCGARSGRSEDEKTSVDAWNTREFENSEIERYKGVIRLLEKDVSEAKKDAFKMFSDRLKSDVLAMRDESDILKTIFGQFVSMIEKAERELLEGEADA